MSKPLILELKENLINFETIQGKAHVDANTCVDFVPNYENIEGEIVGSFLIGGVSTIGNQTMTLTPAIEGIGNYSTVKYVLCKSTVTADIYINIGVLTKKKKEQESEN